VNETEFDSAFEALAENKPFPWQRALYERFAAGEFPDSCNLPTGLGKTSVVAIWLIALANGKPVPRRLVYVVNRRTVVDQTTDEVEKYRKNLTAAGITEELALSTLRGQFADNREWSADPSRPAVICGTVDMIGSRLLFSGYGVGFKAKPLHAGFLGQDALLVHDEAHLEPAFQRLIEAIRDEQKREPALLGERLRLKVMELTATSRSGGEAFPNETERKANEQSPIVRRRVEAKKAIHLHENKDEKKLAEEIAALALSHKDSGRAVLVFARKVDDVEKIVAKLRRERQNVQQLAGTLRGLERNRMADPRKEDACPIFARFLKPPKPDADETERWKVEPTLGTVYFVCTSAGEVGVNISADHLVCDLSTFESMAQRFGRVNRFGENSDTRIDVVHPKSFETKDRPDEAARERTLALLKQLPRYEDGTYDGSPAALGNLDPVARQNAFAPPPKFLDTSDILFDAWALTTVRGQLPSRPMVEPYLHGVGGWEPPETHVAWREEVGVITGDLLKQHDPEDLLEDYPLKPHELLREPSYRAFKHFEALAKRRPDDPVWLLDDDGTVQVLKLAALADKDEKDRINGKTVLLPPSAGGLDKGMLSGASEAADDVSCDWYEDAERTRQRRLRIWSDDAEFEEKTKPFRLARRIDFPAAGDDEDAEGRSWLWFERPTAGDTDGSKSNKKPVLWDDHVGDVVTRTREIVANLPLSPEMKDAVILAAQLHDHGKRRRLFQTILGNRKYPGVVLAKSGRKGGPVQETYRHEFGSLIDADQQDEFKGLKSDDMKDLVLHLIAAHHGRGRPHFPVDGTTDPPVNEVFDPDNPQHEQRVGREVPQRFARLQRRYGRWGLAYLESLLRAADWAASAKPSKFVEDDA
jgi:CRISPR-associated endonuclease/helicase Cas3